jgi:ATP-dependent RNA helicase DeaD
MDTEIIEDSAIVVETETKVKPKRKTTSKVVLEASDGKVADKVVDIDAKPKRKTAKKEVESVETEVAVEVAAKPKRKTKAEAVAIVEETVKPAKKAKVEKVIAETVTIEEVVEKPKKKAKAEKEVVISDEIEVVTEPIANIGGDAKPKKKKKRHEHGHKDDAEVPQIAVEKEIVVEIEEEEVDDVEEVREIEDSNSFSQFALNEKLLRAVNDLGYETPSPIQLKTIPLLLDGNDIVGQAQTGTGKTAAFALPALHLIDEKSKALQVLVLTPTRELAIQVAEAFHSYAKHFGRIKVLPVYGGTAIFQQIKHLQQGVQVVVGTPGRLMDHMRRETLDLSGLKMVVLDEADEMLRMGFAEDVEWILSHTGENRQTALFSATMPRQVRRIAERYLKDAVNIQIEQKLMDVPLISQYYLNVSEGQKSDVVTRLLEIESTSGEAVLIFHRTKLGAANLADKLQARGYSAEAMHGDMSQAQRESVIKKLRSGLVEIVIATDVAARGLDVDRISTVINYDPPSDVENYVHRIGRTGRAGREGKAILLITPRQQRMKGDIERFTKQRIEALKMPTKADIAARRVALLKERILKTLEHDELEFHLSLIEEIAEESGKDVAEVAAAAVLLISGDKPITVKIEPETSKPTNRVVNDEGMVRLFMDVGRRDNVSPSDIVGAIANEGDVPGKTIGAIDVHDRHTLVDVPSQYVDQVLANMKSTKIRSQQANIRIAEDAANASETREPSRPREIRDKSFERERPANRERSFDREKPSFSRDRDDNRGGRSSGGDRPSFGRDRDDNRGGGGRSFGGGGGDRPQNRERSFGGGGDRPSFGRDRDDNRGGGGRSFGGGGGDRPQNRERSFGGGGDRPSFGRDRDDNRGGGRSFGGGGGDRPQNRDRSFGGDRPSFGRDRDDNRGGGGGRSFGGGGGDRPQNRERSFGGDRPSFGRDRDDNRGGGRSSGGDRFESRDKPFSRDGDDAPNKFFSSFAKPEKRNAKSKSNPGDFKKRKKVIKVKR